MIRVLMSLVMACILIGCGEQQVPEAKYEKPKPLQEELKIERLDELSAPQYQDVQRKDLYAKDVQTKKLQKQMIGRGATTFLVAGDSLLVNLGPQIAKQYPQKRVFIQKAKVSTGLCNTRFYNWEDKIQEFVEEYRPDVVILSLGTNDNQGLMREGGGVAYPSKAWDIAYKERAKKFIHLAQAKGARLVWLLPPAMGDAKMDAEVKAIKAILRKLCREEKVLSYDMDRILADKNGRCKEYGAGGAALRAKDGVHVSYAGDILLAQDIIPLLQKIRISSSPSHR